MEAKTHINCATVHENFVSARIVYSFAQMKFFNGAGGYQSGQLGQTVNLLAHAFVGSNPTPPTHAGVAQLVERQPSKL